MGTNTSRQRQSRGAGVAPVDGGERLDAVGQTGGAA